MTNPPKRTAEELVNYAAAHGGMVFVKSAHNRQVAAGLVRSGTFQIVGTREGGLYYRLTEKGMASVRVPRRTRVRRVAVRAARLAEDYGQGVKSQKVSPTASFGYDMGDSEPLGFAPEKRRRKSSNAIDALLG